MTWDGCFRTPYISFSIVFGAATLLLVKVAAGQEDLPPGVVARVNGHPISEKLVQALLQNNQEALKIDPRGGRGEEKLRRVRQGVLDELIERSLISEEAAKRKVMPLAAELDEAERNLITTFGSEESYQAFLKQNNLSREEYRQEVVRVGLCRERLAESLGREHPVTETEIKNYYEQKQDPSFQLPERVSAAHIHLDLRHDVLAARLQHDQPELKGEDLEKAIAAEKIRRKNLANDLRQQLLHGADFGQLAAKYSDDPGTKNQGGDLGTFPRRAHPHEFEEAAFNLKQPGDLSEVVEDFYGLHIIKLKEHQPARAVTLAEASPEIRARLERQNQSVSFQSWLKEAHRKAQIVKRTS
jgi:parvulin-like peptidyl-prolyl isomerase